MPGQNPSQSDGHQTGQHESQSRPQKHRQSRPVVCRQKHHRQLRLVPYLGQEHYAQSG